MKVHTEKITPAKAQGWLDHASPQQRTLSKAWVAILAKRIVLGKWDAYSGTMITSCGVLVDGYHRCSAIVASGKTVDAVVLEYPRHSQWVDDTRRRSVADRNGTSKIIAAATRMAGRWVGINDPDMALMKFDKSADQSESHSESTLRSFQREIDLNEEPKDSGEHVFRDPYSGVININTQSVTVRFTHNANLPARLCVLGRIRQQVGKDLCEPNFIAFQKNRMRGQHHLKLVFMQINC